MPTTWHSGPQQPCRTYNHRPFYLRKPHDGCLAPAWTALSGSDVCRAPGRHVCAAVSRILGSRRPSP